MKRKILICLLAVFLLATISDSKAQQARIYRVGVMVVGSADIPQIRGLRDGLNELGYIPGKNLALDVLAEETYEEYRPLVRSYKAKKPDVIVTIGGTATSVVKETAPETPRSSTSVQTQCRQASSNRLPAPNRILPA